MGFSRGDTAMWVLTKMAMLFFIASLAGILLVFGNYQKTGLCNQEALAISDRVSTALSQIVNSPAEDERRIIQLEPSLAVGDGRKSRYVLNISRRDVTGQPFNALNVVVESEADRGCSAGVQMTYPQVFDTERRILFVPAQDGAVKRRSDRVGPVIETMIVRPSVLNEDTFGKKSTFISIVKCTQKTVDQKQFVFIQDCTQEDAGKCISFKSGDRGSGGTNSISDVCGFG